MKKYISVNVVSQALIYMSAIVEHSCNSLLEVSHLKMPYGINHNTALNFALQCKWVSVSNETISLSKNGYELQSQFDGTVISKHLWRKILLTYISTCQPAWAKRIPFGRKEAFLFMNEEEQECFFEAGLMDSYDSDVVIWWDRIAQQERQKENEAKNEIGRQGELLTIEYETKRTGARPEWRSIETNVVGYDILSQRSVTDTSIVLIEVKTSVLAISDAFFVLTRNEWHTAMQANNYGRYYFYLWSIHGTAKKVAVITVDQIKEHIPTDNGAGTWESIRVPFLSFEDQFKAQN